LSPEEVMKKIGIDPTASSARRDYASWRDEKANMEYYGLDPWDKDDWTFFSDLMKSRKPSEWQWSFWSRVRTLTDYYKSTIKKPKEEL
jgi:hypothetical protein